MSLQVASGASRGRAFGPGRQGLGVQHDPAAVPGAGGVGVVPAVIALAATSGH
jgi:hypothetical protein